MWYILKSCLDEREWKQTINILFSVYYKKTKINLTYGHIKLSQFVYIKMKSSFIFKWPIFIINFATSLKLTFLGQIYPLEMLQSCLTCWTYDFKVQIFFSYCIMLFFICRLIWMVVDNVNPEVYINVLLKSIRNYKYYLYIVEVNSGIFLSNLFPKP